MLEDNNFNAEKAGILISALKKNDIRVFELTNSVMGIDIQGQNYHEFSEYMKGAKQCSEFVNAQWDREAVSNKM